MPALDWSQCPPVHRSYLFLKGNSLMKKYARSTILAVSSMAVGPLVFLLLTVVANAADRGLEGTWEGKENDLPSVELTIRDNRDQIGGTIGFYFQSRGTDGKWHLGEKFTVPLLSPKLDGRVLMFETIHHAKHDSPELGPNNKYRVTFVGPNEARLEIIKDQSQAGGGPALILTRRVVR